MRSRTLTLLLGLLLITYAQNGKDEYSGDDLENENEGFLTQVRLDSVPIAIRHRAERIILEIADAKLATPKDDEKEVQPKFGWNPFTATFSEVVVPIYLPSTTDPGQIDYYEFKVLEDGRGKGYIVLTAKPYQDFVTPKVHFEELDTPTEQAVIQAISNGYKQEDVKKFVRSNAAGDVVAEDKDGKRLSEITITSGESDCPCNIHQLEREELVAEAAQFEEIKKASKQGWDELKINDEIGISIPCNGYDFALSAVENDRNEIIPWEERCEEDLASPFIYKLVKLTSKFNKLLIETTDDACELLEIYKLVDNDRCNITRFTVNGQKYYVNAADLKEYDPDSGTDPLDRGEANTDESDCCDNKGKRYYDTKPWSAWTYYYIPGSVPNYNQHSCCGCVTGCGSVAWAQAFGWADRRAEISGTGWHKNIYRSDGPSGAAAVAPLSWTNSNALRSYTQAIRGQIDTFCVGGSGATTPWDMDDVSGWFRTRNGGKGGVSTKYNVLGIREDRLMECVRDEIVNKKQPAVMGTGWLKHYPTAVAYAHRQRQVKDCWLVCPWRWQHSRWAFVHQGWGGSSNGWIELSTWFCGKINK